VVLPEKLTHIVYVDDEPEMRILVQIILNSEGLHVITYSSGAELLEHALDDKTQLILLDMMMEGLSGPDILQEIKKDVRLAGIPVIFLTGTVEEEKIQSLLSMGAAGVIAKPFDIDALAGQIKSLWEKVHDR
jgi:two-component system, OmpR family, response regulator